MCVGPAVGQSGAGFLINDLTARSFRRQFGFDLREWLAGRAGEPPPVTAGELFELLWERPGGVGSRGRVVSRRLALGRVLKAVADVTGVRPAEPIRPSTPLGELIPAGVRRRQWELVRVAVGRDVAPDLVLPPTVERVSTRVNEAAAGAFFLFVALLYVAPPLRLHVVPAWWNSGLTTSGLLIGLLFAFPIFAGINDRISERFRTCFPPKCQTVGDLARRLARSRPDDCLRETQWTRGSAWYALRTALAAGTSADPRTVTAGTPLIELTRPSPCDVCGYDLRAGHPTCPECGVPARACDEPDAVNAFMRVPEKSAATIARYLRFRAKRLLLHWGLLALAAAVVAYELRFRVPALILLFLGGQAYLVELFGSEHWKRPYLWNNPRCPRCGAPVRVCELSFGGWTAVCTACGVRWDLSPAAANQSERPIPRPTPPL